MLRGLVVLVMVVPAVGAGALLACLYAISDFGAVSILRYDTLATAIYSQYRFSFDRSSAAGLALVLLALALLLAVLIPGVGREVNGSMRWINAGLFNLQVSEPAKLLVLLYLEQLSVQETGSVLGLSEKAVGMRHLRALERIRNLLDE